MVPEGKDAATGLLAGHDDGQGMDGNAQETEGVGGPTAALIRKRT